MEEKVDYLPLGSVVVLKGGVKKYMIIARGLQVTIEGAPRFFDYGGCLYPEGLMGDQVIYFQHANINRTVYTGFSDEDDKLMVENIQAGYEKLGLTHADVNELKEQMEK